MSDGGRYRMTKRTVLVVLVTLLVVSGAGIGLVANLDGFSPSAPETGPVPTETPTSSPTPPEPTVTPPGSSAETDAPATETSSPTEATQSTETPQPTDGASTPDATATATDATATPTEVEPEPTATPTNEAMDSTPVSVAPDLSLSSVAVDDIARPDGSVEAVNGDVDGSLEWTGRVDRVVLVVQTLGPAGNWVETTRVGTAPGGSGLDLEDVLGDDVPLFRASHAADYGNDADGSTVDRKGAIDVTAVLFTDGAEVGRTSVTRSFTFSVTNEADLSVTVPNGERDERRFVASNVAPGSTGRQAYTLSTGWSDGGTVTVFLGNLAGAENGVAEPEAAADDQQGSELLDALQFRVAVETGTDRLYLVGSDAEYVAATRLDGGPVENALGKSQWALGSFHLAQDQSAQLVVEWRLPPDVGNEVMSDSVSFDLAFELTSEST